MKNFTSSIFAISALLGLSAVPAQAGDLRLTIANGRVTLVAQDVTVRQILDEWARVGQTRIVNAEKLVGPPVTLELTDVPESKALETVLRSASGYVLAPRTTTPGPSVYDRIMILATSRPPAVSSAPPPAFNRQMPQPMPAVPVDDDEEEGDGREPVQPPGMVPNPGAQPFPGAPPQGAPGMPPPGMQPPGQQPPGQPGQQPTTATRPGMLPQAPPVPGNPYQPTPPQGTPGPGQQQPIRPPGGEGNQGNQ